MPGVKSLHQESGSNSKAEFIMGHSLQAVSLLVRGAATAFALPVAARIHEGVVWSARDQRTLLVVGALLIAFFVVGRDPTKRIARKIFQQLPADARQVSIRVDETGVQVVSGDTQHLEWAKVTRVTDTRETFLVFASRTNAQILPKRAMTTEQIRTVREFIARHVVPQREPWLTPTLVRRVLIYTVIFAAIWLWYTYRQHH